MDDWTAIISVIHILTFCRSKSMRASPKCVSRVLFPLDHEKGKCPTYHNREITPVCSTQEAVIENTLDK